MNLLGMTLPQVEPKQASDRLEVRFTTAHGHILPTSYASSFDELLCEFNWVQVKYGLRKGEIGVMIEGKWFTRAGVAVDGTITWKTISTSGRKPSSASVSRQNRKPPKLNESSSTSNPNVSNVSEETSNPFLLNESL